MKKYKAIILAAGRGKRIKKIFNKPKCLLRFRNNDLTIIQRLYEMLKSKKISNIIVVTGYKKNLIKKTLGKKVKYYFFKNYNKSNNLQTLLSIKKELKGNLLCFFSDLIFDKNILEGILKNKNDFCIAIDTGKILNGTMRIKKRGNKIIDIGNQIKRSDGHGNFIGISKFSKKGTTLLKKYLIQEKKNTKNYYTLALKNIAQDGLKINFFDCKKYFWKEIDTAKDFYDVKNIIVNNEFKY